MFYINQKQNNYSMESVTIVTGGSGVIGLAVARKILSLGGVVVLVGRDQARIENSLTLLDSNISNVSFVLLDLAVTDSAERLFNEVFDRYGRVDNLVCCHGTAMMSTVARTKDSDLQEMVESNLLSVFRLLRVSASKLSVGGGIVLLSSSAGMHGERGLAAYGMTKGALTPLLQAFAQEVAPKQIRINAVSAGYVESNLTQKLYKYVPESKLKENLVASHLLGRGSADDIANAIYFLISPCGRWITGQILAVDGGYSIRR